MDNVQELEFAQNRNADDRAGIQPCGYLLELSLDWIVLRASENIHHLLNESHVTLIEEPLGKFVQSQALHDLRNLFSRLSGSTGIGRAYRVRLGDEGELFDVAFQQVGDRVILEAVPTPKEHLGEAFSAVGGLAAGLAGLSGPEFLEGAARRMRALASYDRVTLLLDGSKSTSSRTGVPFRPGANESLCDDLPSLVSDAAADGVPIFPRENQDSASVAALLRAPNGEQKAQLEERGFVATMRVPIVLDGKLLGEFRMAHTRSRQPSFELQAAAELFAQFVALRWQADQLSS